MSDQRSCLAIVLAAGEGMRMRSARPKVLHAIAGCSLLAHTLDAVRKAAATSTAVVVGPGAEEVAVEARRVMPDAEIFVQSHDTAGFDRDLLGTRSDHDRRRRRRGFADGIKAVGKKRTAGDGMQHLRPRGAHARPFAGRKHDGKAATLIAQNSSPKEGSVPSISECRSMEKERCAGALRRYIGPAVGLPGAAIRG